MKKEKPKFNIEGPSVDLENFWLYTTRKDGGIVFKATSLGRLLKDSFWDMVSSGLIELDSVYKIHELKQRDYVVNLKPQSMSIISGGKVNRYENAMRIEHIKISLPNGEETSLISYVNSKVSQLGTHQMIKSAIHKREKLPGEPKFTSLITHQILSYGYKSDNYWNPIAGEKNIFESGELLDQLLIHIIILHARSGHSKAIEVLLLLLRDTIEKNVRQQFKCYKESDIDFLVREANKLAYQIITDKDLTRENDHFRLTKDGSGRSSIGFFIAGLPIGDNPKKKKFISKIQEHLKDKREALNRTKKSMNESDYILDKDGNENNEDDYSIFDTTLSSQESEYRMLTSHDLAFIKSKLSKEDSYLFNAYHLEELTLEEIGQVLGIQKAAVSKRVAKLNEVLKKYVT